MSENYDPNCMCSAQNEELIYSVEYKSNPLSFNLKIQVLIAANAVLISSICLIILVNYLFVQIVCILLSIMAVLFELQFFPSRKCKVQMYKTYLCYNPKTWIAILNPTIQVFYNDIQEIQYDKLYNEIHMDVKTHNQTPSNNIANGGINSKLILPLNGLNSNDIQILISIFEINGILVRLDS